MLETLLERLERLLSGLSPEQRLEWDLLQLEKERLQLEFKRLEERRLVRERGQDLKRERLGTLPPDHLGLLPSGGTEEAT